MMISSESTRCGRIDLNFRPMKQMNVLQEIFALMRNSPGRTFGEAIAESTEARSPRQLAIASVLELTFVLRAVEVAFRVLDEAGVIKLPKFVAADSNAFSRAARPGIGSS
jgi:hypothetical protein